MAVRSHRVTAALHSSQVTYITYIITIYLIKLQDISVNDVIMKE